MRNNASLPELASGAFQSLILSPGPQTPQLAGNLMTIIGQYVHRLPVLGVCLGHQALGQYFGASLGRAAQPMHGKVSRVIRRSDALFEGLPESFGVVRYHSLILDELPPVLECIARTEGGELMALRHHSLPVRGIQFHPEAALTEYGLEMIRNWLNFARVLQ